MPQNCAAFAHDYSYTIFQRYQPEALTMRNLQQLRNDTYARMFWNGFRALMRVYRSAQPHVPSLTGNLEPMDQWNLFDQRNSRA